MSLRLEAVGEDALADGVVGRVIAVKNADGADAGSQGAIFYSEGAVEFILCLDTRGFCRAG